MRAPIIVLLLYLPLFLFGHGHNSRDLGAAAMGVLANMYPDKMIGENWVNNINTAHPRLFINRDMLGDLRSRALTQYSERFNALIAEVNQLPSDAPLLFRENMVTELPSGEKVPISYSGAGISFFVYHGAAEAVKSALVYLVTEDEQYMHKAKSYLKLFHQVLDWTSHHGIRMEQTGYSRINAFTAYDWICSDLTPTEKTELLGPMLEYTRKAQRDGEFTFGRTFGGATAGNYGEDALVWFAGVAAYKEGVDDVLAEKFLRDGAILFVNMLNYREAAATGSGVLGAATITYSFGDYPHATFNFFHTWKSAFNEDLAAKWTQMLDFPTWFDWSKIKMVNGRMLHHGIGDLAHTDNLFSIPELYAHFAQTAHFYSAHSPARVSNVYALMRELSEGGASKTIGGSKFPVLPFLLTGFDEGMVNTAPAKQQQPYFHSSNYGVLLMRSGEGEDDTYASFRFGASIGNHQHYDDLGFTIYKKNFLALDAGSRTTTAHHHNFAAQSVAHNTILIHHPEEAMPYFWRPSGFQDDGVLYHNHGGQYLKDKGRALAMADHEDFVYAAGDATNSYSPVKSREVVRQFLYLKPDVFVIYDRVLSVNADQAKEFLLHFQNEPYLDETKGEWGGVHDGKLMVRTVLPASPTFNIVGGPGREFEASGRNWELPGGSNWDATMKLTGKWRMEVSDSSPKERTNFLHVMQATADAASSLINTEIEQTEDKDILKLTDSEGNVWILTYNRTGEIGLTIEKRSANDELLYEWELAQTVYYVNTENTSPGDGLSWGEAFTDLQTALNLASYGDQIWVAQGVYKPITLPMPVDNVTDAHRQATFLLANGVEIYGGFTGTEASLYQRDWENNLTILSGDIGGDDSQTIITDPVSQIEGMNSYNVVTAAGTDRNTVLDGFTITGGSADESTGGVTTRTRAGGGIFNNGGSPTVRNVDITGNTVSGRGAGIYNQLGASPILENVKIRHNRANSIGVGSDGYGGGIFNTSIGTNPVLTDVEISDNYAAKLGGGIFSFGQSNPVLVRVTIRNNVAENRGGGVYTQDNAPSLTNVAIINNKVTGTDARGGGGMYIAGATPVLTNVLISGNTATHVNAAGGIANYTNSSIPSVPILANTIVWGNGTAARNIVNNNSSNGINAENTTGSSHNLIEGSHHGNSNIQWNHAALTVDDIFVDPHNGNYRLQGGVPAIDAGSNARFWETLQSSGDDVEPMPERGSDVAWGVDLDGNPRVQGGKIDLGPFERAYIKTVPVLEALWEGDALPQEGIQLIYGEVGALTFSHNNTDSPVPSLSMVQDPVSNPLLNVSGIPENTFDIKAIRAGEGTLTVTLEETDKFERIRLALNVKVNRKEVEVTADAVNKVYGMDDPSLTFTAIGLVNEDTETLAFDGALTRDGGENVGAYAIRQGDLSAENYTIVAFNEADFTITKASQYIVLTAPVEEVQLSEGLLTLMASSSAGLFVTLTTDDTNIATITGNDLNLLRAGTVTVMATQEGDSNHEVATPVSVTIRIIDIPSSSSALQVHRAVSPNGDGINDFLLIEGIHHYPDNKLTVFDHVGNIVSEVEGYDNERNVFSGSSLTDGTYFYYLDVVKNGKKKRIQRGFFEVKR